MKKSKAVSRNPKSKPATKKSVTKKPAAPAVKPAPKKPIAPEPDPKPLPVAAKPDNRKHGVDFYCSNNDCQTCVKGRERAEAKPAASIAEKRGMFFAIVRKHTVAVYEQHDHEIIPASRCTCRIEYAPTNVKGVPDRQPVSFEIVRSKQCPIDEHRQYDGRQAS